MPDNDEFGLPAYIDDKPPEVGDRIEATDEIAIILPNEQPTVDKVRILMRCGVTFRVKELWHSGTCIISIQTEKGERDCLVYDPRYSGMNAIKLQNPTDIL